MRGIAVDQYVECEEFQGNFRVSHQSKSNVLICLKSLFSESSFYSDLFPNRPKCILYVCNPLNLTLTDQSKHRFQMEKLH